MDGIIIYTASSCLYCVYAKRLLDEKKVSYKEVRVGLDSKALDEMITISGRRTVPQIMIQGKPVGGFDDLRALDRSGQLDELLKNINH